jgi:hypothetical protein
MAFEPTGVYAKIPYRQLSDGSIEALFPGGLTKFESIDHFRKSLPGSGPKRFLKVTAIVVGSLILFSSLLRSCSKYLINLHPIRRMRGASECRWRNAKGSREDLVALSTMQEANATNAFRGQKNEKQL